MVPASTLFHFLRGAVRSAYGIEDFRNKTVLIEGMCGVSQSLITRLCFEGTHLKFNSDSLYGYRQGLSVCGTMSRYAGEPVDISINFTEGTVCVRGKNFPISEIEYESYVQGIHEFYFI
jgi:hypothetical protein